MANDNVKQILESVDDKIIAKKKFKRTIISSVILSAVVVLSAIIISLASINTSVYPRYLNKADSYDIHISNQQVYIDEDSNNYQEFLTEYSEIFTSSILNAMFTGKLGEALPQESKTSFYSNGTEKTGMSSQLKSSLGNEYVKIHFNEEQSLTYKNGAQYYSNRYENREFALKFKDCYVKLDKNNSSTIDFFVGTYDPAWGINATITQVTINASSSDLYASLSDLLNI